jgi:hypothetical protein
VDGQCFGNATGCLEHRFSRFAELDTHIRAEADRRAQATAEAGTVIRLVRSTNLTTAEEQVNNY